MRHLLLQRAQYTVVRHGMLFNDSMESTSSIPWRALPHTATCCNAYTDSATSGPSPASLIPSKIVATTAMAASHIASLERQPSRVPPDIGIPRFVAPASTSACTTGMLTGDSAAACGVACVGCMRRDCMRMRPNLGGSIDAPARVAEHVMFVECAGMCIGAVFPFRLLIP